MRTASLFAALLLPLLGFPLLDVVDEPSALSQRLETSAVSVSSAPAVLSVDLDEDEQARLDEALALFRHNGLALPDLEVRFFDDKDGCKGHFGLFQQRYSPWRISICSDLPFVLTHELAHAWEAANLDDEDRRRYLELRALTSWNDRDVPWRDRGSEDAAFVIQQNLTATRRPPSSEEWQSRVERYELLTRRPSPLRTEFGNSSDLTERT